MCDCLSGSGRVVAGGTKARRRVMGGLTSMRLCVSRRPGYVLFSLLSRVRQTAQPAAPDQVLWKKVGSGHVESGVTSDYQQQPAETTRCCFEPLYMHVPLLAEDLESALSEIGSSQPNPEQRVIAKPKRDCLFVS